MEQKACRPQTAVTEGLKGKDMDVNKLAWGLRGIFYKISFGHFGNLSYIGKPVSVRGRKNICIGDRVRIYPGARMEAVGTGRIRIGDNTSVGQNFHIVSNGGLLSIGRDTTLSANVFITDTDHGYREIGRHVMKQEKISAKTEIGENCFIGYGAVIQAGTVLGRQCVVGANSVVRGKFPDYSVVAGVPAKTVRRYSRQTEEWERV